MSLIVQIFFKVIRELFIINQYLCELISNHKLRLSQLKDFSYYYFYILVKNHYGGSTINS
jgi:hypothetical protein